MASRDEINKSEEPAHAESYVILQQFLSLNSVSSTASCFNDRSQNADIYSDRQEVNQIGSGLQGAIFDVVGQTDVFKKKLNDKFSMEDFQGLCKTMKNMLRTLCISFGGYFQSWSLRRTWSLGCEFSLSISCLWIT